MRLKKDWRCLVLLGAIGAIALHQRVVIWSSVVWLNDWLFPRIVLDLDEFGTLGKSAWEWAELLIVPALFAVGAFLVQRFLEGQESRRQAKEEELAADRNRQEVLKDYLDQMTQLLLDDDWPREIDFSNEGAIVEVACKPIVAVARARTLAVFRELDSKRNGYVVRFLSEVNVLPFVPLGGIDLSHANLFGADLRRANLTQANLSGTNLRIADLSGANLSRAALCRAKLTGANLTDADLIWANLTSASLFGANLTRANLTRAKLSEEGFTLEDFTIPNLIWIYITNEGHMRFRSNWAFLDDADLSSANFTDARNLTPDQVKAARNWEQAIYSDDFRQKLGLPPATQKEMESKPEGNDSETASLPPPSESG